MTAGFPIHEVCARLDELGLPLPAVEVFAYLETGKVMVVIQQHGQRTLEIVEGNTTTRALADRLNVPSEP